MLKQSDFSPELIIKPFRSGIQLVRPSEARGNPFRQILSLPFSSYFMTTTGQNRYANEAAAELCGTSSNDDLIGLDAHDLWDKESAYCSQAHDKYVVDHESLLITDDSSIRKVDDAHVPMISFKIPWYEQDRVIGVYGMTLKLDTQALGEFTSNISKLIATGLIKAPQLANLPALSNSSDHNVYLSKREMDILKLIVMNHTAKQIAERLHLSKRTVENYIANIKVKTNCNSKFALIEKYYWRFNNKDI